MLIVGLTDYVVAGAMYCALPVLPTHRPTESFILIYAIVTKNAGTAAFVVHIAIFLPQYIA